LKHATASEVATVLSSLVTGQNTAARSANQNQANARTLANRNAGPQPTPPLPANAAAAQQAARTAALNQVAAASGLGGASAPQQFSTILTIVPDERSNALVISGTVDDLRLIKDIVNQLDILLAQVRIEVVIAEITLTNSSSTGIEALGLTVVANKIVGFSGSTPGIAVSGGTLTLNPTTGVRDLAATLNLSTTPRKSNTSILSVPNIVTTHNKEATIFVGESRPIVSNFINSGAGGGTDGINNNFSSNVTYRDIGIRLTVKPLIGNDGSVQLEIKQEVNDILDKVLVGGNEQPVIGSRTTESFVSVNSGEIVVLGGLQRKSLSRSNTRFAGIPIIGDLLGKRSRDNTRTDLVFFLRPYVLTNTPADNTEAMNRLKASPQHDDVQAALKGSLPAKP
jgi:general secretion pathway protein D